MFMQKGAAALLVGEMICTKAPVGRRCRLYDNRHCGEVVRGSSTRCNVGSRDVTETLTAAALHAASSRKISISRVTRWFFVMIATGLPNFARTSRQPRVIRNFLSTG